VITGPIFGSHVYAMICTLGYDDEVLKFHENENMGAIM
jgi:hypothetical protein